MMDARVVGLILQKEFLDVRRNRWVALLTVAFAGLALLLSWLGLSGLGTFGVGGFARTTASLLNVVILLVPLMGLLMGAMSIATEREQGTLVTLLAQPVTATEVFVGKWLGMALAMSVSILIGFGLSGTVIATVSGWQAVGHFAGLILFTLMLGFVHLGIGCCLSVWLPRSAAAIGFAVGLWWLIVFVSDLGVMGTAMVLGLKPAHLLWLALANPTQVFRLAVMQAIQGDLELLGPVGLYASSVLADWLMPVLAALLVGWIVLPLGAALWMFRRRGAL